MDRHRSNAHAATDVGSWQLDGAGPDAYERYLVPKFFRPWAERLVDLAAPPGDHILDVCAGTGIVARVAADGVRKRMLAAVDDALRDYTDGEGVVFPMETHMLVATR